MRRAQFISADEAARVICDGNTVALVGGGGGLLEAAHLFEAIERRFLAAGEPRNLTLIHALGLGDRNTTGLNRFAHEGLVAKVVGGHWVWSPRMQALAREEKIAAYVLPAGVLMQLFREIGAGRPGLLSHVGLGTFIDPRIEGGRMNHSARETLVEYVTIAGRELLLYRAFPIHVAIVRGSLADEDGNISVQNEAAKLDVQAVALAARNSGGKVIVQVKHRVPAGSIPAHQVHIPAAWVSAIVVDPKQRITYDIERDAAINGSQRCAPSPQAPAVLDVREVIARRAFREISDGAVVNFGFGIPDAVARLLVERGQQQRVFTTIEHGIYGGELMTGMQFGFSRNASAMIDAPTQFDFYSGGGLDLAFLGFGEIDGRGDVNVSKLNGTPIGPGGFIDIAHNARRVVFCGTFDTRGAQVSVGNGRLSILRPGTIRKLVRKVEQISFSAASARSRGQEITYVTERAVFRLLDGSVTLTEVAPGLDIRRDILDQMDFQPQVLSAPLLMNAADFGADPAAQGSSQIS